MPALLTSTVISPSTASRIRCRSSGLVTSATMPSTPGSRSTRRTVCSAASRCATASPIPRAAPVTIAVMGASYLDLPDVLGVDPHELAGDAAARFEQRDPVLEVLRIGIGADRDGIRLVALGGERAHAGEQRVGQNRAGRAAPAQQVLLAQHED